MATRRRFVSPKKGTKPLKEETVLAERIEGSRTRQDYVGLVLVAVACLDTIVTMSVLPVIALHGEYIPLSACMLVVGQSIYFLPQLWSTGLAERVAKIFGITMTYAMVLMATSISTIITANALRERSPYMYLFVRLMNGLFRHNITLGLSTHEIHRGVKKYNVNRCTTFSTICAMLFGGIAGDYGPGLIPITEYLGFIELAAALVVGVLSITSPSKVKTIPKVHTVKPYKVWLVQDFLRKISIFTPASLVTALASVSQCMYPFTDRRVFNLSYTTIGLHMSFIFFIQSVIAPAVVKNISEKKKRMIVYLCTLFIFIGAWHSPWITENGVAFYFIATLFFIDFPAAILELSLCIAAQGSFGSTEKLFAEKLQRHTRGTVKQWSSVLLLLFQMLFGKQETTTRILMVPIALAVAAFVVAKRVSLALAMLAVICCTLTIVHPIDDREMFSNMFSFVRWQSSYLFFDSSDNAPW